MVLRQGILLTFRRFRVDWQNKVILITGGTGSFGKKCIEILLKEYHPAKIIVFSRDELKQHEMRVAGFDQAELRYFIGDIRDQARLRRAFAGVNIVIHAAALKQVPACEYNPGEAIKTNIDGSSNVIDAALDQDVEKVIALSTDKAVNPVNLYGSTKLAAEKLFVQSNAYAAASATRFSCVRYGNVVGSRGSVVPVFAQQQATGKLTVTDERMTRFWITLEQGVHFVLRSAEQMLGGEVFVPKIPSTRIVDLARVIAPQAKIQFTGIRPGEKLHEILLNEDEARSSLELQDMYIIQPNLDFWFGHDWEEKGSPLPVDFRYTSENNTEWLSGDQIREMVKPFIPNNIEKNYE
jgi:UDP-N-acetylglucosamine 4,6-dehydratase/5-epimerase